MKAYVFPGQGAQFVGMGKDLYDNNPLAKEMFEKANEILGFRITDLMFAGTDEDLRQTKVTQPAIFVFAIAGFSVMPWLFDNVVMAPCSSDFIVYREMCKISSLFSFLPDLRTSRSPTSNRGKSIITPARKNLSYA